MECPDACMRYRLGCMIWIHSNACWLPTPMFHHQPNPMENWMIIIIPTRKALLHVGKTVFKSHPYTMLHVIISSYSCYSQSSNVCSSSWYTVWSHADTFLHMQLWVHIELVTVKVMLVKNCDIVELHATKWSRFMCQPRRYVEGVLS